MKKELAALADADRAKNLSWFFKTGKGEYGEGDRFLGIRVPVQRKVARRFIELPLADVDKLMRSRFHEHRFTAAEILVAKFERAQPVEKEEIFQFYLGTTAGLNNWDLVDTSAPYIVGAHLLDRHRDDLYRLAGSTDLWERRIAIVSTLAFVRKGDLADAFALAELLLGDTHDLIHKAVGWVLRETGRVSRPQLYAFLKRDYRSMPRTALRYAIEHFPDEQRKRMLAGDFQEAPAGNAE